MHSPKEHEIRVRKTARYATLGNAETSVRDVWFVCHGYRQLARRFLRYFGVLDDGRRLIVAPEGLSRFYLGAGNGERPEDTVGASWMTREDRENEIADYVAFLDAVYDELFCRIDRAEAKVTVLGFSQGGAAACRWIDRGRVRADRLVLWAGDVPEDVRLEPGSPIRRPKLTLVAGNQDSIATPARVAALEARLRRRHLVFDLVHFDGGHQLNQHVLGKLARDDGN